MFKGWPRWWKAFGYELVSVIPWDADSDTIAKHLRGKVPGIRKANGKWIGLVGSMVDRTMTEAEAMQAHADGAAIGMMARIPALDIDVEDEKRADNIQADAFERLGVAPVRRREGSARRLLMYGGSTRLRKIRLAFRPVGIVDEDAAVKSDAVEWLGYLQYYNVEGVHPSGACYYWQGVHPTDLGPFGLPDPDEAAIKAFFTGLPERHGLDMVGRMGSISIAATGPRTKLADASRHWAPTPQLVLDLLKEYRPETLGHDEFVQHMAAIKAALGESAEDHYPEVLDWAPGVRSTEDVATRKVWDSITDVTLGWDWLSAKSGTTVAAQHEFADPPDLSNVPEDPGEKALRSIFERWVYDTVANVFYDKTDASVLSEKGFNTENTHIALCGITGKKTAANRAFNDKAGRLERVRTRTYYPGQPVIFEQDISGVKRKAFNIWRPSLIVPVRDVLPQRYIDHLKIMGIDEKSREHLLDWMAFILQNPGKKIGHAPFMWSHVHGVGKDTAFVPLISGLGRHNVFELKPSDLHSPHNTYLCNQFIYCPEMANFEKTVVYNTLKPYLAMSHNYLTVNPKNHPTFQVPNMQNWAFLSNQGHAIPLEDSDRRFFIIKISIEPEDRAYYNGIYQYFFSEGGVEIVVGWLLQRDIRHFNPADPAPLTEAKSEMIMATRPPGVRWAMKQFEQNGAFYGQEMVTVNEIIELSYEHWSGLQTPLHENHVVAALRLLGYVAIKSRVWITDKPVTVWTNIKRPEILNLSGALLAQRLKNAQKKG